MRTALFCASMKHWASFIGSTMAATFPSSIVSAATFCSSAIQTTSPSPRKPFKPPSAVARQQGARSHGLKTALALAKLYQLTSRPAEAHAVLAHALEGFAPTPEMQEIAEAKALFLAIEEEAAT